MRSRPVKRIADVRTLQARQFPEDAGPLAHPVRPEVYHEISNFYTATVYEKGSEVIRMLKAIVGADGFRAGMDLYFTRHDGQAVTVEDFLSAFADATGADLGQFKLWYGQAGTPEVAAKGSYDRRKRTYTLSLTQSCPPTPGQGVKRPMHIPLRFGLVGPNGADLAFDAATGARIEGDIIHLSEPTQTIVFRGVSTAPVPSLLRGFSAPVKLSIDLPPDELLFLLRTDSDPFNRWQAAQMLANRALIAATAAVGKGGAPAFDPVLHRRPCRVCRGRRSGAGVSGPGAGASRRGRHRPGNRPRRRSRRDLHRPQSSARGDRRADRRPARQGRRPSRGPGALFAGRRRGRPARPGQHGDGPHGRSRRPAGDRPRACGAPPKPTT